VILALIFCGLFMLAATYVLLASHISDARFEEDRWNRYKADVVEDDWNQDL
jgi:hypothetical protein